jgi:hypothetical protein
MKFRWQQPFHHMGSANNPLAHIDGPAAIEAMKILGCEQPLGPGQKILVSVTTPAPEDVVSRETALTVPKLKELGFTPITTGQMAAWGYSKYALEEMAKRASQEGYIYDDYVFKRKTFRKQLFARLKSD